MERTPHTLSAPVLRFRLGDEIGRLRRESAAGIGSHHRNAITLVKDGPLRMVLVALAAGGGLEEHATPGPATVHVLAGRVRVVAQGEELECGAEDVVVFDAGVAHDVVAQEESVLLLTLVDPRAVTRDA